MSTHLRALALALFAALLASAAHAQTFTVTTAEDSANAGDGVTSLREAITAANVGGGGITFDGTVFAPANGPYSILLGSPLPDLDSTITITGPGANVLAVDGQSTVGVFRVNAGRVVSISGLTIRNGKAAGANGATGTVGQGGGILTAGSLTLTECAFTGNSAQGGSGTGTLATGGKGQGGAIFSTGPQLTVQRCTFSGNIAVGGSGGNGAYVNTAGAGPFEPGGNAADAQGGAIYADAPSGITISNTTFHGNGANGGAGGNSGFGNNPVHNVGQGGAGGTGDGGAIYSVQGLTVTSCTIAGNSATGGVGGLNNAFINVGANGNGHGGGIVSTGTVTSGNTLIASNFANPGGAGVGGASAGPDVFGAFNSANFNLIGILTADATGFGGAADQKGTDAAPIDAKLDPQGVQDNGGPTKTVRLRKGSPAVDKGKDLGPLAVDQRGNLRPKELDDLHYSNAAGGDGSDIGAFEAQSLPNDVPVVQSPQSVSGSVGTALSNQRVTGQDGDNDTLTFSLVDGTMPEGLTLNDDGTITGTPMAPGQSSVTFKANDTLDDSNVATLNFTITEASSIVVTTDIDNSTNADGVTSLREAINTAANDGVATPVTFDPTFFATAKTITLSVSNGPLSIFNAMDIHGPSAGVTISGGDAMKILQVFDFGSGITVNFKDLTFANGRVGAFGSGNAISLQNAGGAPVVTLTGCTLQNNGGDDTKGGAIENSGATLSLINCTLNGNHADDSGQSFAFASGGAIYQSSGTTTLINCTLSGNHANGAAGGAIANIAGSDTLTLHNTIVAGNTAAAGPNISGAVAAVSSYNLIADGTNLTGISDGTQGNQIGTAASPIDPLLDPNGPTANGGPTATIKLLPGSPAIDQGKALGGTTTDQRGQPRPFDDVLIANASGGDGSDIGAFEVGAPPGPEIAVEQNGNDLLDGFSQVDFGPASTGGGSSDLIFTIKNTGGADLNLTGTPKVSVGGTNAVDFSVIALPSSPVASNSSTAFTVKFTPSALNLRTATISIENDDANEAPFDFTVFGSGVDGVPPNTTITDGPPTVTNSPNVTITFTGTDNLTTPAALTFTGQLNGGGFNPVLSPLSFTGLDDGIYTFEVQAKDDAGNVDPTPATITFEVDTAAPPLSGTFSPLIFVAGTPLPDYAAQANTDADVTVTQSPAIGSVTVAGILKVTLTATDAAQNSSTLDIFVDVRPAAPVNSSLIAKGAPAPGAGTAGGPPPGSTLASFGPPAIDVAGNVTFTAKWTGAGGAGSGLFTDMACLGIVGGDVPGIAGAKFKSFSDPVITGGRVASLITMTGVPAASAAAVFTATTAADGAVVARAGDIAAVDGAKFKSFKSVDVDGTTLAFSATLAVGSGVPKVVASTDAGVWLVEIGSLPVVVYREGQTVGAQKIKSISSFDSSAGSRGQGRGWLQFVGGVATVQARVGYADKTQAALSAEVIAGNVFINALLETGDIVPPVIFITGGIGLPAVNGSGQAALLASSASSTGAKPGVFARFAGTKFTRYAAVGATTPGIAATFKTLQDPVLADDGGLAFPAKVKGATVKGAAGNTLWWLPPGDNLTLLAQGGAALGGVPNDLPTGVQWNGFTSLGIAAGRGPVFSATLVANKGGVTKANGSGVWAMDFTGKLRTLFRLGDMVDGKKVTAFHILTPTVGNAGVTRSFNDTALVVWLATFPDKSQAIVTTEVP